MSFKISETELMNLNKYENVKLVSRKFNVNWGGLNHLKCILYLCEQALKNPDIYYLHLISGSDYPIQNVSSFLDFFKINNNEEYLNYFEIPCPNGPDNGGMDRIEYYNLYDVLNAKIYSQNRLIRKFIGLQKRIGFKRSISTKIPNSVNELMRIGIKIPININLFSLSSLKKAETVKNT